MKQVLALRFWDKPISHSCFCSYFLNYTYALRPEKKKPAPRRRAAAKKSVPEPDDMEESDDDESSEEEFDMDMDNMDQNQLIKDEEDRKHLESLNDLEREAILGERFEQRKKEHDMKVALREAKRKERELKKGGKVTKRKAPSSTKKASKNNKEGDTTKDKELAQSLTTRRSSTRDRDVKNKKKDATKKALAALREVSTLHVSLLHISCH